MTPKERAAMQQALEALREYRDTQMISAPRKAIETLREVLAEQEKPIYRKVLREMLDAHEQAEQEPMYISKDCVERGCACHYSVEVDGEPVAVYSAPVRTKDLTDDEIAKVCSEYTSDLFKARAVVAAYREKNK